MNIPDMRQAEKTVFAVLIGITVLRLVAIMLTPLAPDVEETQYWLWSQTPDAGYFTKPPMIAWVIGLTTAIAGNGVVGMKLAAPLIQLVSALLIGRIARNFSSPHAGILASLIWISLPAVGLGSFIISTDSPMLMFILAALFLLAPLARGKVLARHEVLLAGIFAGLAMMSKYAAIYLPAGVALWYLWQGRRDMRLNLPGIGIFIIGMLISLAPNIVWNLMNSFVTVGHLEHNADLDGGSSSVLRSLGFLAAQAGIAGPLIFGLVIVAVISLWRDPACRFWIALAAPALLVISAQAYFSTANANWAVASWPPLVVLVAHFLGSRWQGWRRGWGMAGIGVNMGLALILIIVTAIGSAGPLTPASDPLRRLRGWQDHADTLTPLIVATSATVIITERRGHAAYFHWLLRDLDIDVEIVDANGVAENHFEAAHGWQPQPGRGVILINGDPVPGHQQLINFNAAPTSSKVRISSKRHRHLYFHPGIER